MSANSLVVLIAILFLFPVVMYAIYTVHENALKKVEAGWRASEDANREVRDLLIARVSTLENRLMTHHWQDFAQIQQVPTELDKEVFAEGARHEYRSIADQFQDARIRDLGDDLEGEDERFTNFEGPTVG